jgi:hypothetical protein
MRGMSTKVYSPFTMLLTEPHELNINIRSISIQYKESPAAKSRISLRDEYALQSPRSYLI